MKKPKKKKLNTPIKTELQSHENYVKDGYNLAIDEYERFLPSKEEILQIMLQISHEKQGKQIEEVEKKGIWDSDLITITLEELAKQIYRRIHGED